MNHRLSLLLAALSATLPGYAKPPNILIAVADDWGLRAGAYGTRWVQTPAFDRVAREGILFSRAYTPNAKYAPSRACLLTGRNSWQLINADGTRTELYDVLADPNESKNLVEEKPDIAAKMKSAALQWRQSLFPGAAK